MKKLTGFFRKFSVIFFFIIIAIFIIWVKPDFNSFKNELQRLDTYSYLLLIAVYLFSYLLLVLKYDFLFRIIGAKTGVMKLFLVYFSSQVAHYTAPGKTGYPLMAFLLKRFQKISYSKSTSVLSLDYFFGILMTIIFSLIGSLFLFKNYFTAVVIILVVFLFIILLMLVVLHSFSNKKNTTYNNITLFLKDIYETIRRFDIKGYSVVFSINLVSSLLSAYMLFLLISFFGKEIPLLSLFFMENISFLIGAISFVPMGLGVQDASLGFLLSKYGISTEMTMSILIIRRAINIGVIYALGLSSGLILGLKDVFRKNE
jgi:uncharacterized protein (TIRG00374 family)